MSTALVLGGGASVQDEWAEALALGEFDHVVACNDVGTIWPGRLDAWVTLHPEKFAEWREQRLAAGLADAKAHLAHEAGPPFARNVEYRFPGQPHSGSSGLFAVKAALVELGAERVVLAGIGLVREPHFFDAEVWESAVGYREPWAALPRELTARIRSMGGWTASFFGAPTPEWIATGSTQHDQPKPQIQEFKMADERIIYEPHPVSRERKAELRKQGFKIIDVRFAPPEAAAEPQPENGDGLDALDVDALRNLAEVQGLKVHHSAGADRIREQLRAAAAGA